MTPEQKRLDKYYLRKFGWTLAEVDAMFAAQGNVCAACGRPPGERRMSVDHDHRYDKFKIVVTKEGGKYWHAVCEEIQHGYTDTFSRKNAREWMRRKIRRLSVRGGLCLRCNKGLAMFEDSKAPLPSAERLERLAQYLRRFAQGKSHEASVNNSSSCDPVSESNPSCKSQD